MPSFPRPSFTHNYQVDIEINNLRNYKNTAPGRAIPAKSSNRLLIATWGAKTISSPLVFAEGLFCLKKRDF